MTTMTYTVTIEVCGEFGEGHALVTSEAGTVGVCGVIANEDAISGYCDLGAIILRDASSNIGTSMAKLTRTKS